MNDHLKDTEAEDAEFRLLLILSKRLKEERSTQLQILLFLAIFASAVLASIFL